jgi:outer membrane protein assembly factor BamB
VALEILSRYDILQLNDVESDARGNAVRNSALLALLINNQIAQFAVDQISITPPIPLIPSASQTVTGTLNSQIPYTMSQEILEQGRYTTALGEFGDCILVGSALTINEQVTTSRTRYCAGVGEVADETTDANGTRHSEIVAASVGDFVRGSSPVVPKTDENASLQRIFPEELQGNVVRVLDYKEPPESRGITTNVLPLDGTLLYGTASGALVAFDRAGERELWRFQTGDSIFSTPVVSNGIAYFASADKKFYAVRVSDGAFVWAFPMQDVATASPAARGDTVYVASEDRHVYALDADTGLLRWQFQSGSPFVAAPVLDGEQLIVSNDDGGVFALNAATGAVNWDFAAEKAITGAVQVQAGVVYVGSFDQHVYALNAESGEMLWSQTVLDNVAEPVLVRGERVYVGLYEEVVALDTRSGASIWRYDNANSVYGAPILLGDQVWILGSGNLIALDASTGKVVQDVPTSDSGVFTGISSDGNEIYAGFFDGQLLSFAGGAE